MVSGQVDPNFDFCQIISIYEHFLKPYFLFYLYELLWLSLYDGVADYSWSDLTEKTLLPLKYFGHQILY